MRTTSWIFLSSVVGLSSLASAAPRVQSGCSTVFGGMLHEAAGGATMSKNGSGHLVVSNIGSSGLDGVDVKLGFEGVAAGTQMSHEVFLADVDPTSLLPSGAFIEVVSNGIISGVPDQNVGSLRAEKIGTEIEYSADFSSFGALSYTLEIYDAGAPVFASNGNTGPAFRTGGWLDCFLRGCPPDNWNPTFGSSVSMALPSGMVVVGDEARLIAETVHVPPDWITSTSLRTNIPSLTITGETVAGRFIRSDPMRDYAIVLAEISAPPGGGLVVSNIGSSGCDGVRIQLPAPSGNPGVSPTHTVILDLTEMGTASTGAFVETTALGTLAGVTDSPLASVKLERLPSDLEFVPNFDPLGGALSPTYTIEAYLGGLLVHSDTGNTGPAFRPLITNFTLCKVWNLSASSWDLTFNENTGCEFTISGGPASVIVDRVVLTPENVVNVPTVFAATRITAKDIPSFRIDEQTISGFAVENYCTTGASGGLASISGSTSISENDFWLEASNIPSTFGLFYFGPGQSNIPFGQGTRCVGGGIFRVPPAMLACGGTKSRRLDFTTPPGTAITAGSTWNFQYWLRLPPSFDLTDAVEVSFQP